MTALGSSDRPLRVAIIGSGPSGFYATEALFKGDLNTTVDLYDRLPIPFGLVRGGVAPDHPKIKKVAMAFNRIADNPNFSFFGNVTVGRDIMVDELRAHYDAVMFTSGAETDRKLGIPGEDLTGSRTATEFVAWYNGHPDYRDLEFDLSGDVAVVVGQGNVAMDVTRILSKTVDELKETDIAKHALEVLAESQIKEVHLVGRRGPAQAKFTPPEIREIGKLSDSHPLVQQEDLVLSEADEEELKPMTAKPRRDNIEVLREFASRDASSDKSRRYYVHFYKSPVQLNGTNHLESVTLERNRLEGEAFSQRAIGTGEQETISCQLLLRSVGYRGVEMPGVPFDDKKGVFPNMEGRITENGVIVPGMYTAGWIKRGPSGVIGTNKPDSIESANHLLADAAGLTPSAHADSEALRDLLKSRNVRTVSWSDWKKIDAAETAHGETAGKPREKFTRVEEMLAVLEQS
jgi:ferredoxin/flavodoxin---NADP+ reductase